MEISDSANFYIRAMVLRGFIQIADSIQKMASLLQDNHAGTIVQMAENMMAYERQLLRESIDILPEDYLPSDIDRYRAIVNDNRED